jgi:hypothetical protein
MRARRFVTRLVLVSTALGLVLPLDAAEAPRRGPAAAEVVAGPSAAIPDVELDQAGSLHGLVVNVDGLPVALASVIVAPREGPPLVAQTDPLGKFHVAALRGGLYQVAVGPHVRTVRAWAARTAPPHARDTMLLVVVGDVARGQMPAECVWRSDMWLVGGVAAALSSIPLSLASSDEERPVTP